VFCPNCGTQNPDAAQTCSKCSFHLKSAAAPKFKGTMLMMNQPGALPGTPLAPPAPPGRPGAAAPPPPGAGPVPSKLKGTMVGVAPMGMGAPIPPPPAMVPTHTPPPPPAHVPMGEAASAFSPPVPQGGVNPLGGTVAADAGVFGAFAVHGQGGAGAPGAAPPYGPPHGQPGGGSGPGQGQGTSPMQAPPYGGPLYGAPPQHGFPPFGVPPPAPGTPGPPPYGTPPPNAYGGGDPYGQAQPPVGYGQPMPTPPMGGPMGQGMVPYGQPPSGMVGTLKSQGGDTAPTRRNALMTLLLPGALMFGGIILSVVLAWLVSPTLLSLVSLFMLAGGVWYLLLAIQMISELKSVTRSEELAWWPMIVPIYQLYFMWFVVPQEVAKAKQMVGARQPPQHMLFYIFLWPFALASDLNDLVR
jgi:zinc ribbon protein